MVTPEQLSQILHACPNCLDGRLSVAKIEDEAVHDRVKHVLLVCEHCRHTEMKRWRPTLH
jgi:hypothetical protein